jgi:cell division protein FtsZ
MDFSIGEFEEVGNTIKQFASDNATVVVGTVIDPEMSGDLRVTIVATGLGNAIREDISRVKLVQEGNSRVDYKDLDRPTVIRNKDGQHGGGIDNQDPEYLDIPAFLRRQAD